MLYVWVMTQPNSLTVTVKTTPSFCFRLILRILVGRMPTVVLLCVMYLIIIAALFFVDLPEIVRNISIACLVLSVLFFLLGSIYFFAIFVKAIGYPKGEYAFTIDSQSYTENTLLGKMVVPMNTVRKVLIEKTFTVIKLSVGRKFIVPTSPELTEYLKKNFADKVVL